MDTGNAFSVDSTVTAPTCNLHLREAGFPEQALHKSLEGGWRERLGKYAVQLLLPFLLRRNVLGSSPLTIFSLGIFLICRLYSSYHILRVEFIYVFCFWRQRPDPSAGVFKKAIFLEISARPSESVCHFCLIAFLGVAGLSKNIVRQVFKFDDLVAVQSV